VKYLAVGADLSRLGLLSDLRRREARDVSQGIMLTTPEMLLWTDTRISHSMPLDLMVSLEAASSASQDHFHRFHTRYKESGPNELKYGRLCLYGLWFSLEEARLALF